MNDNTEDKWALGCPEPGKSVALSKSNEARRSRRPSPRNQLSLWTMLPLKCLEKNEMVVGISPVSRQGSLSSKRKKNPSNPRLVIIERFDARVRVVPSPCPSSLTRPSSLMTAENITESELEDVEDSVEFAGEVPPPMKDIEHASDAVDPGPLGRRRGRVRPRKYTPFRVRSCKDEDPYQNLSLQD